MSELVEFLTARLDEDEAMADALHPDQQYGTPWDWHSRARVLREVEAKRWIVEFLTPTDDTPDGEGRFVAEKTLLLLVLPYADHPSFREEWRP